MDGAGERWARACRFRLCPQPRVPAGQRTLSQSRLHLPVTVTCQGQCDTVA